MMSDMTPHDYCTLFLTWERTYHICLIPLRVFVVNTITEHMLFLYGHVSFNDLQILITISKHDALPR